VNDTICKTSNQNVIVIKSFEIILELKVNYRKSKIRDSGVDILDKIRFAISSIFLSYLGVTIDSNHRRIFYIDYLLTIL